MEAAMTSTDNPTEQVPYMAPPAPAVRPKRVIEFGIPMLLGTIIVVLILGFAGGIVAQSLFPAQRGPAGAQGKQGAVGQAGPQGPAGNAANINLSAIGYCFGTSSYSFNDGTTPSFITDVFLFAPTDTNGTKSCSTGSFVPLENAPAGPTQ
jgi:hypothetical protein